MKILAFTAGAANMYCGSCLRDNALAAELIRRGHDVMLLPIYTPTLTDERNVSADRVFFGGISVYLEQRSALFRHTPRLLDRLWDSTAALRLASRRSIALDPAQLGELTVSMLRGRDGNQRKELDKLTDWLRQEREPPDLVTLPNSMLISLARPLREATNRPVVCTLQGEDVFIDGLADPYRRETLELIAAQVEYVDAFVAVSDFYARFMCDYLRIPPSKMRVVPLGVNAADFDDAESDGVDSDGIDSAAAAPAERRSDAFTVGFFARVAPEKGLRELCEAYKILRAREPARPARLEAAGYLGPEHRKYLDEIKGFMRASGLASEFRYHGALDRRRKIEFLRGLDVFSVPAPYDEPKGLSVLEAMAAGVPAVQPRRGAYTEIIERTGGGLLVEPDDPAALAVAIRELWQDGARAAELGRAAAAGVREHYSVARMADRALEVYGEIVRGQ